MPYDEKVKLSACGEVTLFECNLLIEKDQREFAKFEKGIKVNLKSSDLYIKN